MVTGQNRVCVFRYTRDGLQFVRKFGTEGVSFGQFTSPSGITVDAETHAIYVADHSTRRLRTRAPLEPVGR